MQKGLSIDSTHSKQFENLPAIQWPLETETGEWFWCWVLFSQTRHGETSADLAAAFCFILYVGLNVYQLQHRVQGHSGKKRHS